MPRSPRPIGSTRSPRERASRGSPATAARSRPSGSSPRRSRSSTRRPRSTRRADRLIEAADWIVWQLTGVETRNSCTAGYKAMWSKSDGFPAGRYFAALDPRFAHVVDDKMSRVIMPARRAGRRPDRAGGGVDRAAPRDRRRRRQRRRPRLGAGRGVTSPARMVAIMGTSICHIVLAERAPRVEGMCGVVEDGVIPGLYGYEAGQSAVGDIFAWFVGALRAAEVPRAGPADGRATSTDLLEAEAAAAATRARAAFWRSTGGTATGRCLSTPTCAAC